jgi:hypothetical protein
MTATRSPDPIETPQAYQQHLLSLLGDDDPAVVQEATPDALRVLVTEAGPDLKKSPSPGEWSVWGCIAHIADAELVMSARYRWILAQDQPSLIGYDQDLWVDRIHPAEEPVEDLLAVFEPLRQTNLTLWRRSGPEQRTRVGLHRERGPESYDLSFRMIAGHDRFHLNQARRALTMARTQSGQV